SILPRHQGRSPTGRPGAGASMKIALVHDWLTGMRGGERCLEVFAELLPRAPILTLFHERGAVSPLIEGRSIAVSPLSRIAPLRRRYRSLLPLFPWAIETLPGRDQDLLISLSHCAAKAIPKREGARHICYCFTPARYLWDLTEAYLDPRRTSLAVRIAARALLPELKGWDRATSTRVDRFIAISRFVAERIRRIYGRESEVIYPPVEARRFAFAPPWEIERHYLMVSALAPYKGVDLAIRAFNRWRRPLRIIGKGPLERRLRAIAGDTIEFLGWLDDREVAREYARCRAFILPCEEDFGITPLEAMAAGRPVIALGRGGALETVRPAAADGEATGLFFEEPEVDSLIAALERLEGELDRYDPDALRRRALEFDSSIFRARIRSLLVEEGAMGGQQSVEGLPAAGAERGSF
ncbi:MAG: glycosyltransferase, partial [Planctomycetota bacterium]